METLDDWILEEMVGSGGLAEVWRARPLNGERAVALKRLREPDRSEAHRERFLREGHLLRRLSHPNLLICEDVVDGPQPYLVLELLIGETLSERLREAGQLPIEHVLVMADTLLKTLSYLHDRGITHRDVKSSNVYLSETGRVLLLDLGLATDPNHPLITTLGDVMGTYAYMAPEQIAGAQVDHRCDLYSLGVTLYEALAGVRPYRARDAAGYLKEHREGEPRPLPHYRSDIPVRMLDLIARLMARDPADRPASAGIARALLTSGDDQRALRPPPLIGRRAAEGAIQASLDESETVIIHGEIGSGTARIANYALTLARNEGMETLAVRCRAGAHPLAPLYEMARDLTAISGPVDANPAALGRALRELAAEAPLLLLIENIEQAPPETIAELSSTMRRSRGVSVVITAASPPEGLEGHMVYLRPLRPEETRKLICAMLSTNSPPAGLSGQLHRISGGLPGVVVQGLRELEERGSLVCDGISDDGSLRWTLDRSAPLEPTSALARLFGGVLSELQPNEKRLLEVLAVAGEPMPLTIALQLAGSHPSGEEMGVLLRRGLADRQLHEGREWISVRRPAVGTLVRNHLPDRDRRLLHRGLAASLKTLRESTWRDQLIRWHEAHGAPRNEAAIELADLGEELHARGHHSRALAVLERAAAFENDSTMLPARLAILRGEALDAVGRRAEAFESLTRGHRLAKEIGQASLLGRALVGLAHVYDSKGEKKQAADLAEEALKILSEEDDDPSLLSALLLAAGYHRLSARRELAAKLYNRCIDLAVDQDRREYAAMGHGGLGAMLAEDGHLKDAIMHIEQEAAFARLNQLPSRLAPTLFRLSTCYQRKGEIDLAIEAINEAEKVAQGAELPYEYARARIGRANIMLSIGDLNQAGALLAENRVALQPSSSADLKLAYREAVANYRLAMGDRQAALATFQAAELDASRAGLAIVGAYFLGMVGVLTADPEALLEAMDLLEDTGDRRLSATLLYYGGTVGGDAEVLEFAVDEARASGDRFLLLDVLHAVGGTAAQHEARALVQELEARMPPSLVDKFQQHPAVRWANYTEPPPEPEPSLPPISTIDGDFSPDFELLEDG
ncbi:MAG: serine/threonine-protein kinase [Myxococcota bacterium]